jgi:hypothetical protein
MGTRSRVGVMHGDKVKSVYCHYDGYLECTGQILLKYYDSPKANELIALGDNSGVKERLEDINFYRARGETDIDYQVAHSFEEFLLHHAGRCMVCGLHVCHRGVDRRCIDPTGRSHRRRAHSGSHSRRRITLRRVGVLLVGVDKSPYL